MRKAGIVGCAMLYTLSMFLMLNRYEPLGKNAIWLLPLSALVFLLLDLLIQFPKKKTWFVRYVNWPLGAKLGCMVVIVGFVLTNLVIVAPASPLMIRSMSLTHTPAIVITLAMGLVIYQISLMKQDRFESFCALLGWLFLLGFLFLSGIGLQMPSHAVLPFTSLTTLQISQGIWFYLLVLFFPVAVVKSLADTKDYHAIRIGVIGAVFVFAIVYAGQIYLLGETVVKEVTYPTITAVSILSYGNFLQRLELIAMFGVATADIVRQTVLMRFCYRLLRVHFTQLTSRIALACLLILVIGIQFFLIPSFAVWYPLCIAFSIVFGSACILLWIFA